MNKKNILIVSIVVVIAVLGFMGYRQIAAKKAAAEAPTTETAVVVRGDLSVTVEAAGSLTPPTEITLAFPVAGKLYEIPVLEGQAVKQGDLLARLEDNIQAEADFQALFTDAGGARVELAVANAEKALDDALGDFKYRIGTVTYYWEGQLKQAEETLAALDADPNASVEQKAEAQKVVDEARVKRDYFLEQNLDYLEKEDDWRPDAGDIAVVRSNLENAKVALQDANAALEIVKAGSSALQAPLTALGPEMARLESTRLNMENTRLTAQADGVVTTLYYQVGEFANPGTPVIALTDVSILEADVNLDETDVVRIATDMTVVVTVDAFPGMEVSGKVIEIAPTANIQSGVVLYSVTVRLDPTDLPLRSGMTTNVVFPIEQRNDILMVPFRAIETEGGQAYLTQVTATGSERVAVTMGLITDTQIEILSGIEEGDVVTVYANPVQDTELMHNPMFSGGQ
ncbi:MAG TPA: efflux RND transporter periplasmic adaptor subunit [Anaerolineales bacterium]|nr:efflux RND transporter periplasmic adaptor subunit [Anaerolineales bacterium]